MHRYLMFRNPGVAPKEGFMTFGVSTTRSAGVEGTIGRFGTGTKQAVALCLRNNISPIVYCGTLRLTFSVRPKVVDDGLTTSSYGEVWVRLSGKEGGKQVNREQSLNFVTEVGEHDWNDMAMACREFTANCLDRSLREGDQNKAEVCLVDDDQVRAKDAHTTVYLPAIPEVVQYYREMPKRFLHFTERHNLTTRVLRKAARALGSSTSATIYKDGVFVRSSAEGSYPALYDYNFQGEELHLDESRQVDEYAIQAAAARSLASSDAGTIASALRAIIEGQDCWEAHFDSWYLTRGAHGTHDALSAIWQAAWTMAVGDNAILTEGPLGEQYAAGKGLVPITVTNAAFVTALRYYGIRTVEQLYGDRAKGGKLTYDSTPDVDSALLRVWSALEAHGLTMGKNKPAPGTFVSIVDAGRQTLGFRDGDNVYIHRDIATGCSPMLLQTMLEEVAHYITDSADGSRDFADFAFRVAASLIL